MTEAPPSFGVRLAVRLDAEAIRAIYNDAVATTVATFDTEPRAIDGQLRWLEEHAAPWVALVAESGGQVLGWASLSQWSERRAYDRTAEVSIYVAAPHRGVGVGHALLAGLIRESDSAGFHTLLARVSDGNPASLRLHRRQGFVSVGIMREVGWKFGRWIHVELLQRLRPEAAPARLPPWG